MIIIAAMSLVINTVILSHKTVFSTAIRDSRFANYELITIFAKELIIQL